jgi:hypothetical protein
MDNQTTTAVKPTAEDFKIQQVIPAAVEGQEPTTELVDTDTIDGVDAKGSPVKYVLLSDKRIATIKQGKGRDAERATMESKGNQSLYMSSLMAATVSIDDQPVTIFILSDLLLKDYMAIQVAFSAINF